jgi:hypothetical protein
MNVKPTEVVMACEAGRPSVGDGPGRDRTSARGFEVRRSIH